MNSRNYEQVLWQSDSLARNIEIVQEVMADAGCRVLAKQVPAIGTQAGPLNFSLAQWSKDDDTTERNKAATVAGELMSAVAKQTGFTCMARVIPIAEGVLRWEHGFEALSAGFTAVSHDGAAQLLCTFPERAGQIIGAIWLSGLLIIAGVTDDLFLVADDVRKARTDCECLSACAAMHELARKRLTEAARRMRLPVPVLEDWPPRKIKFWYNAVFLAIRYRSDQTYSRYWPCFQHLMEDVAEGGCWPLDDPENESFQKRARNAGVSDGFWAEDYEAEEPLLGGVRIEFVKQPLEVLNMGNAFDTCLRLKGAAECAILGWAANVNVRIVAVKGEGERVIGRCTIGLSIDAAAVGLQQTYTYPRSNSLVHGAINQFTKCFGRRVGLQPAPRGTVLPTLCAPGYPSDWVLP